MTAHPASEEDRPAAGREATIAAIGSTLADLQAAYDDRDRAMARYLGVGRTDLRCLDLIVRSGPQTASELGVRLHLTRGSMTTLIDRLERAGYVQRHHDPRHRKRKLITPTPRLVDAISPAIQARRAAGAGELRGLPTADLHVILRFLQTTLAGQDAIRQAYLSLPSPPRPNPSSTQNEPLPNHDVPAPAERARDG